MRKFINNYSMHNLLLGFKKAYSISFLPPKVEYINNLLLVRIFRVIGGISILIVLYEYTHYFIYPLNIFIYIFGTLQFLQMTIINIIKFFYGSIKLRDKKILKLDINL